MADLAQLDSCRRTSPMLQAKLSQIAIPLHVEAWSKYLGCHPDQAYAINGITRGFRIGFEGSSIPPVQTQRNMKSVYENPQVISVYIESEIMKSRMVGSVIDADTANAIHTSPFGAIPKQHQPGKWRLIVNLSSPKSISVNDGINQQLCSLQYTGIDAAVQIILRLGKLCMLAKLDLKDAYRVIPVHPEDRCFLRMKWQGNLFLDTALPFGLRSTPKIFSAVADGLLWAMACNGIQEDIHYLDDFLLAGKADTLECASALDTGFRTCHEVGFPVAMNKVEGPSTNLTFLGILFDTAAGQLHLPQDKLGRILHELERWSQRKVCTKRELLSIIGLLQHAASIVKPGRIFLRHMINLSKIQRQLHHRVRLNKGARSDLLWWSMFIKHWKGCSVLPNPSRKFSLHSDASGSWGCGVYWEENWFQYKWPEGLQLPGIATKELLPIV